MNKKSKGNFSIDHLDPLAQGVSKNEDDIYFISNTLPEEQGTATIDRQKKNIFFGRVNSEEDIEEKSPKRVTPECPHFFHVMGVTTFTLIMNMK